MQVFNTLYNISNTRDVQKIKITENNEKQIIFSLIDMTRLISIESQPKKIVVVVVVVIGVDVIVVHVVAVVIPVVDTRNIPNKVWFKPGY